MIAAAPSQFRHTTLTAYPNRIAGVTLLDESPGYTGVYLRDEKVGAGECHVLELTAKRKGATYQRILYWLRIQDARPVRAEFYLTSGKHIKSATFDEFMTIGGRVQLRRLTLYDEIRHNSHSVLEYSNIAPRELPDKLFYQGRTDRF